MKINFSAPINDTGYGIASLNILKELYKLHSEIAFFPIGQPAINNQNDYDLLLSLIQNSHNLDIDAPFVKIWHQFDLAEHVGRGKYYAYPFFELDTFNKMELKHLQVPDELFVSSEWAKSVIRDNGIDSQVNVVPLGVNRLIFNEYVQRTRQNNDKYVFLNIGKWEVRKGHDILYKAFKDAFSDDSNVELWILAPEHNNSYSKKEEIEEWHKKYTGSNIKVIRGVPTHDDVAKLIAEADCGIYPSRAEGWNLELLETMSMNKPVIATNYSAHTEFCNSDNSYLVDISEKEYAYDGKAFKKQGSWAKIGQTQYDQIIDYMRYMVKNNIKTNPNGVITAKRFSWKNSATILSGCIS
jgi:glycosyltransferase involved in cell wall biosynthesis